MPQTTYTIDPLPAFAGTLASSRDVVVQGRRNDAPAAAEMPYGKAVMRSTAVDGFGMVPVAAGGVLLGVLVRGRRYEGSEIGLLSGLFGDVVSKGPVYVQVENAVAIGDNVLVRIDSGGLGAGSIRGGAAVAASLVSVPQARFVTAAAANGIAELELNLPAVPSLA
jgi:hypothetical protein